MSTFYKLSLSATSDNKSENHSRVFCTKGGAERRANKIARALVYEHGYGVSSNVKDSIDLATEDTQVQLVITPTVIN